MNSGERVGFDAIGCVGILMVMLFIGVFARGFLNRPSDPTAQAAIKTPTSFPPSTKIVATDFPTRLPTLTQIELEIIVTPAAPSTQTSASSPPTETPIPPTETLSPFPTDPPPTLTPFPTNTPLPTPTGVLQPQRVSILMYHYISDPPPGSDKYRFDLSVSPDNFRQQLTWLRDNGYTTIDLYQLSRALTNHEPLPPNSVILTFDDSHRDHYTNAFPLLKEFGMTGTFFVITGLADTWNDNHLHWPMMQEMYAAGMDIEMHTRTHPTLSDLERDKIAEQISDSRNAIAHNLNYAPRYLAYPGGRYNQDVLSVVEELNLWGAVTTAYSIDHTYENRYRLDRVRMRYTTNLPTFAAFVRGEIDP